jgi:hypothetical protein
LIKSHNCEATSHCSPADYIASSALNALTAKAAVSPSATQALALLTRKMAI